jgi:hypothetical protein
MCIVIDVNTLPAVFKADCAEHADFKYVKEYIESRAGVIVFGGSQYMIELAKMSSYLKLFGELSKKNYTARINDRLINQRYLEVLEKTADTDCDDQHIIAILGVSRCPLLCSRDKRSFPYVKRKDLYEKHEPRVVIYSSKRNVDRLIKRGKETLRHVI